MLPVHCPLSTVRCYLSSPLIPPKVGRGVRAVHEYGHEYSNYESDPFVYSWTIRGWPGEEQRMCSVLDNNTTGLNGQRPLITLVFDYVPVLVYDATSVGAYRDE